MRLARITTRLRRAARRARMPVKAYVRRLAAGNVLEQLEAQAWEAAKRVGRGLPVV